MNLKSNDSKTANSDLWTRCNGSETSVDKHGYGLKKTDDNIKSKYSFVSRLLYTNIRYESRAVVPRALYVPV